MDLVNSAGDAPFLLTRAQYEEMLFDVHLHGEEEACGLIGGKQGQAFKIYPVTNSLHSPTRFRMDASGQVKALIDIERNGWDLLAIYHSHLHGPGQPSETDTTEFAYPGVTYLIINLSEAAQIMRGFRMTNVGWTEIPIKITD